MTQNKKIRILFTIPNFKTAGSQYVLLSLYQRLDREVFDPFICVEKYPEAIPDIVPKDRRIVFDFEGRNLKDLWSFRKLLVLEKINIVHSWDFKSNYLEALATKLARVPYLYTKKNNAWSKRWMLKTIFSIHVAYDNPEMKDRFFNSVLFRNKITFIPHGVDTNIFKPLEKTEKEFFNIGCIGIIGSNKNQLFLVKTLKSLPENVTLHFYGNEDGEYRQSIDRYIDSSNLNHRVTFHGYIVNESIPHILKNFDLFVLPSFQEGMPVSILEALACGIPVLSSDSGGGARYILDEKSIFSPMESEQLIDKIREIYFMDKANKSVLTERGIKNVLQNFSIDREVMAYEELYVNLLDK